MTTSIAQPAYVAATILGIVGRHPGKLDPKTVAMPLTGMFRLSAPREINNDRAKGTLAALGQVGVEAQVEQLILAGALQLDMDGFLHATRGGGEELCVVEPAGRDERTLLWIGETYLGYVRPAPVPGAADRWEVTRHEPWLNGPHTVSWAHRRDEAIGRLLELAREPRGALGPRY